MSFSRILSAALQGLEVKFVSVEADLSSGLPSFHMVGYLSAEVKEAQERVRTAIRNSGIDLPARKTVINLAPADIRKRGTAFDLPVALAILASLGRIEPEKMKNTLVIGELSLDGRVRRVNGILPIVAEAKKSGVLHCILPKENEQEGALVSGIQITGVRSLEEVCGFLNGRGIGRETDKKSTAEKLVFPDELDFSDVSGQETVKRAAEIAAAGRHNLLLLGPPGSGKSMIAKRISGILPKLTPEESLEITKVYSVMGMLDEEHPLINRRPFREVHHTVTRSALIGGGTVPRPGEISLASKGVLFLDELAEFKKEVLESLRQPLEERKIRIVRNMGTFCFPADFMLVSAMNPCPCGYYPDYERCSCTPHQIQQYLGKVSHPFLDRMDICVEVPRLKYENLKKSGGETSETIRKRIMKADEIQKRRYQGSTIKHNAEISSADVKRYCRLHQEAELLADQAFYKLELTARTYHKILKVARTIADLDGQEMIEARHLGEAIGYRAVDKKYWR